jgi:hypothetical protein
MIALAATGCSSQGNRAMSFTEEFTDQVGDFATVGGRFTVTFLRHAAEYEIRFENDGLPKMAERLATAWRSKATVKITAQGTEIVGVELM